ncbi:MAG: hypothetical protein R3253_05445 [Longimicrobiales bacterium]|nr:hypothetical protein [Longimicrobiales bacterium]
MSRLWDRFTHWVERRFVQGAHYRLLLIAALIGLISVSGGWIVLAMGSGFDSPGQAVWWAFLRLTDPGYLGDDVGAVNRVVSTVLTILGYVVFLGALVAVMTQWLDQRMERLESGLTAVTRDDHVLILGNNNRTHAIISELLLSQGRVRRFLRRHGTRDLHIVVLAEEVDATVAHDLRDAVGEAWDDRKVTLRSGTPLRSEHLERVDALHASAIIVSGSEFDAGGGGQTDARTIKTLLSLTSSGEEEAGGAHPTRREPRWPFVVAEIFDARKVPIAERAYPGGLEIVASDAIVSRLLAQNVRHPGLSQVYNEILTHGGGAELYVRTQPELSGRRFDEVAASCTRSVLLGVIRITPDGGVPHLNPPGDLVIEADDRLVHLAPSYDETELPVDPPAAPWSRRSPRVEQPEGLPRRVLVLGWNNKVPALVHEFSTYEGERFEVVILSTMSAAARSRALERYDVEESAVRIRQVEGDYAELADLQQVDPASHDAVLLLSSDRREGPEDSDARTIVGSLLLQEGGIPGDTTQLIIELLDPDNERLVDQSEGEIIISPLILSHMLAHVALRPELGTVFSELFTAGGAEITFRPLERYLSDTDGSGPVSFQEIRRAAHARGEVALGVVGGGSEPTVHLCPPADSRHDRSPEAKLVTLLTYP